MTLSGGILPFSRDAVSVFYSPNRQGKVNIIGLLGLEPHKFQNGEFDYEKIP